MQLLRHPVEAITGLFRSAVDASRRASDGGPNWSTAFSSESIRVGLVCSKGGWKTWGFASNPWPCQC